jgi:hypothetical protein
MKFLLTLIWLAINVLQAFSFLEPLELFENAHQRMARSESRISADWAEFERIANSAKAPDIRARVVPNGIIDRTESMAFDMQLEWEAQEFEASMEAMAIEGYEDEPKSGLSKAWTAVSGREPQKETAVRKADKQAIEKVKEAVKAIEKRAHKLATAYQANKTTLIEGLWDAETLRARAELEAALSNRNLSQRVRDYADATLEVMGEIGTYVSENPAHGGHTFLSTVYDLGRFYHIKTDADAVKEYYWRLEAYGNAFTSVWEGLSAAKTDAQISSDLTTEHAKFSNPLCRWLHSNITADSGGLTEQKCTSEPVYRRAYQSVFAGVTAASARGELAGVLSARAKLKYVEAFNEAYPTYTAWSEFHTPSDLAIAAASGVRLALKVPAGFKTAQVKLDYASGKWALKALGADGREHILWSQTSTPKEEFFGELQDKRGNHLYRFGVDGATATIKTISTGYEFALNNNSATVVVANGDNFGILDISAFPRDVDNWNEEDNVITIKACKFIGQKGLISACRGSVWLEGQEIALGNKKSVKKRHSNGCEYDHFSAGGQVIGANRFVTILFPKVDISGASLYSQQMVQVIADDYIWSLASITDAPYLYFYAGDWHPDVQVTYAGIAGVDPYVSVNLTGNSAEFNRRQAALTMNHDQTVLSYGRNFHYFVGSLFTVNSAEFNALFASPHGYGLYGSKQTTCPTFTSYTTVTVVQPQGGGRRGGSGFGGMGGFGSGGGFGSSGFSGFGQHGTLGGSALSSMAASSVHVSNADFSVSNRGGAVNVGGSMTLASMLGSTTMEFASSHGNGGSTTALYSIFTPPSLAQAAAVANATGRDITAIPPQANPLLMLHGFNAQSIQLLTQPRGTHLVQEALKLALPVMSVVGGTIAAKIGLDGTAKLLEIRDRSGAAAATGNMPDPDSDGEGDDRKVNCAKAESPVWKELRPYKGRFRIDAKGDRVYEWDHLHNDIEVYDKSTKNHLGSIDPKTGEIYKAAIRGRTANIP